MNETTKAVMNIIAEQLGLKDGSVKLTHHLKDDLAMDELHIVELMMMLEEKFDIEIDDDAFGALATVQAVVDFILDE